MKNKLPMLAIVTPGLLPVPATNGGAVESLCEIFLDENETQQQLNITVFSSYDSKAALIAKSYKYTKVNFIYTPKIIQYVDIWIYTTFKFMFPKKNTAPLRYIVQRFYFTKRVAKLISIERYDNLLFENQILLLSSLKKYDNHKYYNGRYLLHTHNQISRTYGNKKLVLAARNITVSQYISDNLRIALGDLSSAGSYHVVRNGIDQESFSRKLTVSKRRSMLEKLNIEMDQKILLFVGRLTAEKGIDALVSALQQVEYTNYKLLVVGSSFFGADVQNPFEYKLKKLADPVKDKIIFTGHVAYSDMPDIYSIADIAVLPSVGVDAAPLTIIESLTAGLPIITTDSGGIPEYVNSKCAKILKRDDMLIENIAKNIDKLLVDEQLYLQMSQESLRVSKKLTRANYYRDMLEQISLKED